MVTKIFATRSGYLYIKERMDALDLTDQKVADRVGVDRVTITRWRSQQHRLNPPKIAALARALNCEIEELFRPPATRPSLDALVRNASEELQDTAVDIVRSLVARR